MGWQDAPPVAAQEGGGERWKAAPPAPASAINTTPGGAATGRAKVPPPRQVEDSTSGFISGNLNKGIAGLAGLPVDTMRNAANLGIAGMGTAASSFGKPAGELMEPLQPGPGSSQWFEQLMRRGIPSGFNWDMSIARTPPFIGPSAEPQSGGGRYAAAALQMIPSAALGRPGQVPNVPQALKTAGTAVGAGVAGQAGADIGGEEWRGPASMLPGGRSMQQKSPGERATAARQAEAFGKAKEMGIPVPPSAMRPDKPQQKIQDTANRDLRQPEGTEMSPANLKQYIAAQYEQGYTPLEKGMPPLTPNKAFQETIKRMAAEELPPAGQLPSTFKGNKEVLKLLGDYQQGTTMQPKVAMRAIKKLRDDASTNFSSDKPEKVALAKTQKGIANALEQLIDDNLAATGNQQLLGQYRQARTMIAKAHDYLDALAPGNNVSGAQLAQAQVSGKPLSGGAQDIAQVAGKFPGAVAPPKESADLFTQKVSPMAITHPPAVLAHQFGRMFGPLQKTAPYQSLLVDPRNRLSPEQERGLRYLMAAMQENQGGVPTPPR